MLALIGWMRGYCAMVEALEGHSLPSQQEIPATHTTVIAHVTHGRLRRCSNRPMPTLWCRHHREILTKI